jgi:hypothetical protein
MCKHTLRDPASPSKCGEGLVYLFHTCSGKGIQCCQWIMRISRKSCHFHIFLRCCLACCCSDANRLSLMELVVVVVESEKQLLES